MNKQIFPIETATSCLLKWAWSSVFFNDGTTASCHRTKRYPINIDNFESFHNHPAKLIAREHMLNGMWPGAGCEYCKNVEDSGGISDSLSQLEQQQSPNLTPPELLKNNKATAVTPTILEVWFTNTCNMACVYCGPQYSSIWEQENRKFNKDLSGLNLLAPHVKNANYNKMVEQLWQWLAEQDRYKTLQRYHVLGGEPFLLKELDASIDFWNNHGNPDLVFSIISNLNIPHERFQKYIKKFERLVLSNKIWKLQLTASLDGWGPEQEYVRYGLDLSLWQKNFEYLLDRPWISLSINSVISALTIKQFPALVEKINQWNTKQKTSAGRYTAEPILHSFISSRLTDNIYSFGPGVFDQEFEQILNAMPADTKIQQGQKDIMQGISVALQQSTRSLEKIKKLQQYLDEIDHRRKTNWKSHFPWLNNDFTIQ